MSLRIALLTTEFPSEAEHTGGMGAYAGNITAALQSLGHACEVFVISRQPPGTLEWRGVTVHRVPAKSALPHRVLWAWNRLAGPLRAEGLYRCLIFAKALGDALARREREVRFDFVQSTNCGLAGRHVPKRSERPHVLRLSSTTELVDTTRPRRGSLDSRWISSLETHCVLQADRAYAPSELVANHFRNKTRIPVQVLRPPAVATLEAAAVDDLPLPPRFLLHFGQIGALKGADWLAAALVQALAAEPGIRMVWAGREVDAGDWDRCKAILGPHADKVLYLGPLAKPRMLGVLRRAAASVLPSRVDNLPNTAIESLAMGVPVIGSIGASIDELVEPGSSGELVAMNDVNGLAAALLRAWRSEATYLGQGFRPPAILQEMQPAKAAENLIRFALG